MRKSSLTAFLAVSGLFCVESGAQEAPIDRFHSFFGALPGTEWTYHTRMTNPDGSVRFDGTDIRDYRLGMRGRFIIENVYSEEDGKRVHTAVQLMGVNAETGELNLSAFWPWQSTSLGDVSAEIRDSDDGGQYLVGIARPAGQAHPTIDFECHFEGDTQYQCVSHTTLEDGTRFKSNVETYTRRSLLKPAN